MVSEARDKEYLAQDWLEARIVSSGVPLTSNGRNSHPDFIVGDDDFECKSLSVRKNGKPCRKTFDFNSTPPVGVHNGREQFVVHVFYDREKQSLSSACVCHASLINDFVFPKENEGRGGAGTYGDGYVRVRKMYVFPHALDIVPDLIGKISAVVPARLADPTLKETSRVLRGGNEFIVYEI